MCYLASFVIKHLKILAGKPQQHRHQVNFANRNTYFFLKKEKPVFCFHILHLQQRARAICGLLRQQDEHAELLLHVRQLQDLHTVFRDVVVGQLLHLVHHLNRLALILLYQQSTIILIPLIELHRDCR